MPSSRFGHTACPALPCPDHICLQVSRMVHAIKMGWIQPRRPRDPAPSFYDLWAQEDPNVVLGRHKMHVPAPKLALPGHAESYNPPPEYLPSEEEVGLAQVGFVSWALAPAHPPLCVHRAWPGSSRSPVSGSSTSCHASSQAFGPCPPMAASSMSALSAAWISICARGSAR